MKGSVASVKEVTELYGLFGCQAFVFGDDAFYGPAARLAGAEAYDLIGIFDSDVIRDLTVGLRFVQISNPVRLVILFNTCQESGRQFIRENVVDNGLVFFAGAAVIACSLNLRQSYGNE